jgi:heterodisulfide reductase subunit A
MSVYILYRDIMTLGFNESYYTEARKAGVIFIEYDTENKPRASIPEREDDSIIINALDPVLGRTVEIEADLLVLATGIVPEVPNELSSAFGFDTDTDGFFMEAESKWQPVDGLRQGVFACGVALSPRSVSESIATACAAAQRALRILSHERLSAGKVVATVRHSLCSLCEQCIEACPYIARICDHDQGVVTVNPVMCQGCGTCATVCPNSASVVLGFSDQQMLEVIDSALEGAVK